MFTLKLIKMKKHLAIIVLCVSFLGCKGDSVESFTGNPGTGRGGSLAKFTIAGDHLYIVDHQSLKTFDIKNEADPKPRGTIKIEAFAETIFPFQNNLLVGTRTGMFIYSLVDPLNPRLLSVYNHFAACDPVVAEGKYAYVTLRSGNECRRGINQLDIIDISNLSNPLLVKTYPMSNPHGLGVNGNLLFLCEGDLGLKVFNKQDPLDLKLIINHSDIPANDVIPLNNHLITTGKRGITQFGYNQKGEMDLFSKIEIE
jgi:hypothetical protein